MAGSKDSQPPIRTPERPVKAQKPGYEASPFSLFARELPPITSLHAYAESLSNVSFSPDAGRAGARSKIYGVLSPTAASRSSDGFDMLASLLPSPLRSPPAPAPYATAGSSVNRLGGPQVLMSDIGPSGTSYDGRQTLATSLQERHASRPSVLAASIPMAPRSDASIAGRNQRRRVLNFSEHPSSCENTAVVATSLPGLQVPVSAAPAPGSTRMASPGHLASSVPRCPKVPEPHPADRHLLMAQMPAAHSQDQYFRPPPAHNTMPAQPALRTAASLPASVGASRPSLPAQTSVGKPPEPEHKPAEPALRSHVSLPVADAQPYTTSKPPAKRRRTSGNAKSLLSPGTPSSDRPNAVPDWAVRRTKCNCKKTRCLKLYCECFKAGQYCTDCNCAGCGNTNANKTEVDERRVSIQERDPRAFEVKTAREKHRQGCNCKKSSCAKKYCECFEAGIPCGVHCKCNNCHNGKAGEDCLNTQQAAAAVQGPPEAAAAVTIKQEKDSEAVPAAYGQLLAPLQEGAGTDLRRASPTTPIVKQEAGLCEYAEMPPSLQEGCDSATTASPPAMVSNPCSVQDGHSYIETGSVPMVLLPIIQPQHSPDALDCSQWTASQSISPWCTSLPGSDPTSNGSTTSGGVSTHGGPQLYQLLLHKTPDGKLVPYGALAGFRQVPDSAIAPGGPPARQQLAFDDSVAGVDSCPAAALPYLEVSPHSVPAAALLASPPAAGPFSTTPLSVSHFPHF